MNAINTTNIKGIKETAQKDIEKGQKILAAVYLVTSHVAETDAIRQALREMATIFVCASSIEIKDIFRKLEVLMGGAVFAGLISEKNSSVIVYEMKKWSEVVSENEEKGVLLDFFHTNDEEKDQRFKTIKDIKKTYHSGVDHNPHRSFSLVSNTEHNTKNVISKSARQDTILSFINVRKSAVIKDIVSLFPDVSEKTVQRELNLMIEAGKITKRGSKRWSMYMAVNSLL